MTNKNKLFDNLPVPMIIFDHNAAILDCNQLMLELSGYQHPELTHKKMNDIFPEYASITDWSAQTNKNNSLIKSADFSNNIVRTYLLSQQNKKKAVTLRIKSSQDQHICLITDRSDYRDYTQQRLAPLYPVLQKIALGDFSTSIDMPDETDEFSEHFIGINLMIDDLRDMTQETTQKTKQLLKQKSALELINHKLKRSKQNLTKTMQELEETTLALENEKNKYHAILQSTADGVIAVDLKGKIILMNNAATNLINQKKEPACSISIDQLIPFYEQANLNKTILPSHFLSQAISSKKSFIPNKQLVIKKNISEILPIECVFNPIMNEKKQVIGAIAVIRDISDQLEMEAKTKYLLQIETFLRESSEKMLSGNTDYALGQFLRKLRTIIGIDRISVYTFDKQPNTITIKYGCRANRIPGLLKNKQPINVAKSSLVRFLKTASLITKKDINAYKIKTIRDFWNNKIKLTNDVLIFPIFVGANCFGFLRLDMINSKINLDDQLRYTCTLACQMIASALKKRADEEMMKEVDRLKTEFVSVASHQLRTPLSAMHWMVELLTDPEYGSLNEKQTEFIKQIDDSLKRLIELVNELLNLSRIESGKLQSNPEPVNLVEITEQIIYDLSHLAASSKLRIKFNKPLPEETPLVYADRRHIGEVIRNYLNNALKYSKMGGLIQIKLSTDDENVQFACIDNGIGIPNQQQSKIFTKFFRAENTAEHKVPGTGLGLYVCKSFIEIYNGKVWFKSIEDKGSSFYFSLPVIDSHMLQPEKTKKRTKLINNSLRLPSPLL